MSIDLKDIVFLAIGTVVGLIAGVALYWWPLGQFMNEWRSLWHLTRKRYARGDDVLIRAGTDFQLISSGQITTTVHQDSQMKVWHDEGIGWHHTPSGWRRSRILHVFLTAGRDEKIYRICHWDLK